MRPAVVPPLRSSFLGENDSFPCHRYFTTRTAPRYVLDDMPVAVAGREILAGVRA